MNKRTTITTSSSSSEVEEAEKEEEEEEERLDKPICSVSKQDVLKFCEGDSGLAREVVRLFCERVTGYHLPEIKAALLGKDARKLRFHLDTLNGSSGYVGAEYLRLLCGQISKSVQEEEKDGIPDGKWDTEIQDMVKELCAVSEKTVESLSAMEI